MSLAKDIASHLLKIEAVYLKPEEPFTWASGIKSPIYTDNRVTLASVSYTHLDVYKRQDLNSKLVTTSK